MKQNIKLSLFFILIYSSLLGQSNTKKYIKKNKDAHYIKYGDSSIYARGLLVDGDRAFIGNSDGSIYYYNFLSEKSQLIFKQEGLNEIRDIEKVDSRLIAMHSGESGVIVDVDLNGSIKLIQPTAWHGVFLDGVDFKDDTGFMMGDPKDSVFSLYHTLDGGRNWSECNGKITAIKGEAGFAASGSNVQVLNDSTYVFVSGGQQSRFHKSTDNGNTWKSSVLPYYPGESIGPYSMCFMDDSVGVLVGGDYKDAALGMNTCFYTQDGGESWMNAMSTVRGYRSCVFAVDGVYYACGRNGIDFSFNGGIDWIPFANGGYFALATYGDKLIATSKYGTIYLFDKLEPKK